MKRKEKGESRNQEKRVNKVKYMCVSNGGRKRERKREREKIEKSRE